MIWQKSLSRTFLNEDILFFQVLKRPRLVEHLCKGLVGARNAVEVTEKVWVLAV